MARTKALNIVLTYTGTEYVVNDLGETKSPRFELYHIPTKSVKSKSNNPLDFDAIIDKIFEKRKEVSTDV